MGEDNGPSPLIRCECGGAEWSAMKSRFVLCLGVLVIFIVYQLFHYEQRLSVEYDHVYTGVLGDNPSTDIALSTCSLAEFPNSGWTTEVIEQLNAYYDPTKGCDRNFTTFTVLGDNGTVWLNTQKDEVDQVKCKARALYWKSEVEYSGGEWQIVKKSASSVVFDSDFVHTSCHSSEDESEIVEDFVHFQMWEKASKSVKTEDENESIYEKPNVFIFVLDSVSYSQALRSLPKTIELLEREFETVAFKHMNKVGENSHPNGMAFLMGKLLKDVDRSVFGMGKEKADWNQTEACQHYFDNHPFILKQFTKKGYKSLMAEDNAEYGTFTYYCKGFLNPPTTHYSRPFQIHYEMDIEKSEKFMGAKQCLEPHNFILNYLSKFISAYKDSPKIAMLWSLISHGKSDNLYHLDGQLVEYFTKHKKIFDNSFVYLLGDHGMRIGEIKNTWIGQREINNPMLYVSVPRHLRTRLNPTLKENSDQLMTPFDVHASLVDILSDAHLTAPSGPKGVRGQSIFRPFQGERSCRTLPIPIEFCLCEWNKTASRNEDINIEIAIGAVKLLNEKLEMLEITNKCKSFTLSEVKEVGMIDQTNGLAEIRFATSQCGAEFKTIVRVSKMENGRLHVAAGSNFFTRWDTYGDSASCMKRAQLRPLCCCRWWSSLIP